MTVIGTGARWLVLILGTTLAGAMSAQAAEAMLKAQTALPRNHDLSKPFIQFFVERIDKSGAGTVKVNYLGGPEVNPADRAAAALQRGTIDMLHSPAAYYTGTIPYGQGMMARTVTPDEVRKNGGMAILEKSWNEKLNAHILAWGEAAGTFYLYFGAKKPKLDADGAPDLKGMKMRSTGAYRAILTGLGATLVATPATDVYTALQRGVVQGFGWPNTGLKALGLHEVTKYRIEPPFYGLANMVIVNLDKWKGLSNEQQAFLTKSALSYEKDSNALIERLAKEDTEAFLKAGGEIIKLEGKGAKKYQDIAYGAMWKRMGTMLSTEQISAIKPKLYNP